MAVDGRNSRLVENGWLELLARINAVPQMIDKAWCGLMMNKPKRGAVDGKCAMYAQHAVVLALAVAAVGSIV